MTKLEKLIISKKGRLIKTGTHKIYVVGGRTIRVSHSKKAVEDRGRHKQDMRFLLTLEV